MSNDELHFPSGKLESLYTLDWFTSFDWFTSSYSLLKFLAAVQFIQLQKKSLIELIVEQKVSF